MLATIDIPQADDLDLVYGLTSLLASEQSPNTRRLGLVARQVSYYRHAARILGFLDEGFVVTSVGREIARTDKRTRDRLASIGFRESRVGCAWAEWSGFPVALIDPETAEPFLLAMSQLSESTRLRRVKTLRAWLLRLTL